MVEVGSSSRSIGFFPDLQVKFVVCMNMWLQALMKPTRCVQKQENSGEKKPIIRAVNDNRLLTKSEMSRQKREEEMSHSGVDAVPLL